MKGVIKNIQADKRFGFLRGSDGTDRFFHASTVAGDCNFDALERGDEVEFDHEDGPKGPRATGVRLQHAAEG
jgi:cold shock CspA family protein